MAVGNNMLLQNFINQCFPCRLYRPALISDRPALNNVHEVVVSFSSDHAVVQSLDTPHVVSGPGGGGGQVEQGDPGAEREEPDAAGGGGRARV